MTGNKSLRTGLRAVAVVLAMTIGAPWVQAAVVLLKDGRAQCTIVLGEEDGASFAYSMDFSSNTQSPPSQVLTEAANDLADHLNEMGQIWTTADKVPVVSRQEQVRTESRILLGSAAIAEYGLSAEAAALPYPAYICRTQGNDLLIFGSSSKGTANGVYGFLQDELGVRWFGPQDDFRIIPKRTTVSLEAFDRKSVPSLFGNRSVEGRIEYPSYLWGRRLRMPETVDPRQPFINASHNLNQVFPTAVYAKEHPEYYFLRGGSRQTSHAWAWSLCWSNPEIVKIAASAAKAYFRANPKNQSFSLGINDTNASCECPECAKLQPDVPFRGGKAASDMYYHFVNQVARVVKEEFPDRFIGTIAYNDVTLPPSGPVEKNVHVVIVTDISEYFDVKYRAQDAELIRAWQGKGITLGLYYYLGLAKLVPAYFPHLLAETLKDAHRRGFTGAHSETTPGWPWNGPMAYVESRLLWDIELNADDLLREYFTALYGPAAKPMADLYGLFEEIHLRPREGGFLYEHYKFAQFRPYTGADLQRLRQLLADAHAAIPGLGTGYAGREGKEGQRVAYVSNGLKVFLDMLEGYVLAQELSTPWVPSNVSAMAQLEAIQQINALLKRHPALYRETILADPSQSRRYTWDTCRSVVNQWQEFCSAAVATAMAEQDKWSRSATVDPLVKKRIERELAAYTANAEQEALFRIKTGKAQFGPNLVGNPGFEDEKGNSGITPDGLEWQASSAPGWSFWQAVRGTGSFDTAETAAHGGKRTGRMKGVGSGTYLTTIQGIKEGEMYHAEAWVKNLARTTREEKPSVSLQIKWLDANHRWLPVGRSYVAETQLLDQWVKLEQVPRVPPGAAAAVILLAAEALADDGEIVIDDISFRKIK